MATEQREKLYKVLEFYQYDQKDYPVCITLQERSEADLVMLEYIMTSNTYKDDVEGFISDMAAYEFHQHLSLEEWYKDTMEMEDEEDEEECPDCCDKTQWIPRSTKCRKHWVCGDSGYCDMEDRPPCQRNWRHHIARGVSRSDVVKKIETI